MRKIQLILLFLMLAFVFVGCKSGELPSVTITYDVNGATTGTAPDSQTKTYGKNVQLAAKGTLARTGYDFAGWNTKADGTGTYYAENDAYSKEENVTLYAAWTPFTFAPIQESGVTIAYKVTGLFSTTETFTNLVIPDIYKGLPVTEIAASSLTGTNLSGTLTLGRNLTTIGNAAFMGCSNITGSLAFPSTLKSIGNNAFNNCTGLTGELSFPATLTTIGNNVFDGCTGIEGDLLIPATLTSIGTACFAGIPFTNVTINMPTIPDNNSSTSSLKPFASLNCSGTLTISSETIGESAFADANHDALNCNLVLAEGVKTICKNAFISCGGLKSVTFPTTLKSIGDYAFIGCSSLSGTLSIDKTSLETIGISAFAYCTQLSGLSTFPKSLSSINSAFNICTKLTGDLVIPETLTTIENPCFMSCPFINVTINMQTITSGSFYAMKCSGTLTITSATICDGAFHESTDYPACLTGKVCLTNDVNTIGADVFEGCSSLNTTLLFKGTQEQWDAKPYKFTNSCSWGPFKEVMIVQP